MSNKHLDRRQQAEPEYAADSSDDHQPSIQSSRDAAMKPLDGNQTVRLLEVLGVLEQLTKILNRPSTTSTDNDASFTGFGKLDYSEVNTNFATHPPRLSSAPADTISQEADKCSLVNNLIAVNRSAAYEWHCLLEAAGQEEDNDSDPHTWPETTMERGMISWSLDNDTLSKMGISLWNLSYLMDGGAVWTQKQRISPDPDNPGKPRWTYEVKNQILASHPSTTTLQNL